MIITKRSKREEEWILITPEIAEYFLSCSLINRPETYVTIEAYARDMAAHKWFGNGETITFDWNGNLRNGHHRCRACIKANTPFEALVVFGLDPKQCDEYDRGKNRTFRDKMIFASAEKWMYNKVMVAIVRTHLRVQGINKPTDNDIECFMIRNAEGLKWCYETFIYKAKKHSKKASVALAIFYAWNAGINRDDLIEFSESVDVGLYDISKGTAVYRLVRDLDSLKNLRAGSAEQKKILIATENAIKDFVGRRDRTKTYLLHANPIWSDSEMARKL